MVCNIKYFLWTPLMWLLALLSLCMCAEYYETVKDKTRKLHELTKLSTYYELFGLGENATEGQIKRAFRKLRRAAPPTNLTKQQYDYLVTSGYSLLYGMRDVYDSVLRNSAFVYLDEKRNYKNHLILMVIVGIMGLLFLDGVVYAVRYVIYFDRVRRLNALRGKKKQKGRKAHQDLESQSASSSVSSRDKRLPVAPELTTFALFLRLKRYFVR